MRDQKSSKVVEIDGGGIFTDCCKNWIALDDHAQSIWLSHAKVALPVFVRLFRPRFVSLFYHDSYRAQLTTVGPAKSSTEHGLVNIILEAGERV